MLMQPQNMGAPGLDSETWDDGKLDYISAAGDPGLEMLMQPQHEGAPGLDSETWDSADADVPSPCGVSLPQ